MADEADDASALQQREIDALIARHRAKAATQGRKRCPECGAAVSDLRRQAGARLCVPCQTDVERRLRGLGPRGVR